MRVLHVINGEFYSGAEKIQDLLAGELVRRGHFVELFRLKSGNFDTFLRSDVVLHTSEMTSKFDRSAADAIVRLVAEKNFDILHSHSPRTIMICAAVRRKINIPVLHHLHTDTSKLHDSFLANMTNTAIEYVSCRGLPVVSCSNAVGRFAKKYHIGSGDKYVVDNGIPTASTAWQTSGTKLKSIGTVGLQRPEKATEDLIRAFAKMQQKDPELTLTVVGAFAAPAYEAKVKDLAKTLGINKGIKWLGHQKNVLELLLGLDIFVLPSRLEGLPIALLEAMSLGMPCVVSDIPANAALIKQESNGLMFPVGDTASFAESVLRLSVEPALAARLGLHARSTQMQNYSLSAMTDGIERIYFDMLSSKKSSG